MGEHQGEGEAPAQKKIHHPAAFAGLGGGVIEIREAAFFQRRENVGLRTLFRGRTHGGMGGLTVDAPPFQVSEEATSGGPPLALQRTGPFAGVTLVVEVTELKAARNRGVNLFLRIPLLQQFLLQFGAAASLPGEQA